MQALLKEPVGKHPDIKIPVKIIKVEWVTNEAYVQGVEERTFMVRADNLIFEKDDVLLIAAGRLTWVKDYQNLIKAFRDLGM